jgi:type IV secretory pathway VirB2 component (pilin)
MKTKGAEMQTGFPIKRPHFQRLRMLGSRWAVTSLVFLAALPMYAQSTDPWDNAVTVLKTAFTGTIATRLSPVAIVVGGLMFAYGEGQSKRMLAGIVFGVGMAVGAVNFMAWLFPS